MDKIEQFELFMQKARKLIRSSFAKKMANPTCVNISWESGGQKVKENGPVEEEIDAFILTYRFFIQDNESISLRNMTKVFEQQYVEEEIKLKYGEARTRLNEYLDESTGIIVGEPISRRKLLDAFIYGDLAHSNLQKKKIYDEWMKDDLLSILLKTEFRLTLINVVQIISYIGGLCEKVVITSKST